MLAQRTQDGRFRWNVGRAGSIKLKANSGDSPLLTDGVWEWLPRELDYGNLYTGHA